MSREQKTGLIVCYLKWLFESGNESFINFMAAWVKLIMFINNINYEYLKNSDNYETLTNSFFKQEVELE